MDDFGTGFSSLEAPLNSAFSEIVARRVHHRDGDRVARPGDRAQDRRRRGRAEGGRRPTARVQRRQGPGLQCQPTDARGAASGAAEGMVGEGEFRFQRDPVLAAPCARGRRPGT